MSPLCAFSTSVSMAAFNNISEISYKDHTYDLSKLK